MSLVSFCVPTWNAADHLDRSIRSLLAQRNVDFEIHVCDDASQDATLRIAESFDDSRLHVHASQGRLGLAGNWNRAVSFATGDYVCLFGQDDVASPDLGATLSRLLDAHPDASLAFGRRSFAFDDAASRDALGYFFEVLYPGILSEFYAAIDDVIPPDLMRKQAMRHAFEINLIGEPSFVLFRRDHPAVEAGFDTAMKQMVDWEFYTRLFASNPIVQTETNLGTYRLHASGASTGNAAQETHWAEYDHLLKLVEQRFAEALSTEERDRLAERHREIRRLRSESGA
ncbi:MAG: glycosyltransferase family 2 protein [Planctomycetes bacterium]|nr:glycosyltransferase family 2 protein [Planctomycetota bacterium]